MIGGAAMELGDKTLEAIGQYVRENLGAWMRDAAPQPSGRSLPDSVLLERLIRIEEELKAQRNLMEARFDAVDKRFESVDKRFEDLIHMMDKRFDAVDKRFSSLQWVMGLGFTLMAALMAVFNFF